MPCREAERVLKMKKRGLHKELLNKGGLSVVWEPRTMTVDFLWEPQLGFGRMKGKI